MRIRDSRPLRQRLSDAKLAAYLSTLGQPVSFATPAKMRRLAARSDALRRAHLRRRATLAAWDRAVAVVQDAYYADWATTTPEAIATYCAEVATLRAAGLEGPDDTAIGR